MASLPPDVSSVAVSSRPHQVTFSEAVDVPGTPRLKIDMDPAHWGENWETYKSGTGTNSLTFMLMVYDSVTC